MSGRGRDREREQVNGHYTSGVGYGSILKAFLLLIHVSNAKFYEECVNIEEQR